MYCNTVPYILLLHGMHSYPFGPDTKKLWLFLQLILALGLLILLADDDTKLTLRTVLYMRYVYRDPPQTEVADRSNIL